MDDVAILFGVDADTVDVFTNKMDSEKFMESLREPLKPRSNGVLDKVWNMLDVPQTGTITTDEIKEIYDSREFNGDCVYLGNYTDPNHPDGSRTITLLDEMIGDKRMAQCKGNDDGVSPDYILPAWINADMSIVIDFSPKGGPKDFNGSFTGNGITFEDGNTWPWVPTTRDVNLSNLMTEFGTQSVSHYQFMELALNVANSVETEDQFIYFLEQSWGVKENE